MNDLGPRDYVCSPPRVMVVNVYIEVRHCSVSKSLATNTVNTVNTGNTATAGVSCVPHHSA